MDDAKLERGPYLSTNRAIQLERRIAAVEARLLERCDQLERAIGLQRDVQVEALRAMTGGLLQALRGQLGPPHDKETP